jgi:integrase
LQKKLTQAYVTSVQPGKQLFKVRDTTLQGLVLHVAPSGNKTWYIDYYRPESRERTDYKLGRAELFTVAEARDFTRTFLASVHLGKDPGRRKKPPEPKEQTKTLSFFLENHYIPWFLDNHKRNRYDIEILRREFFFLGDTPIEQITISEVEQWRTAKKRRGIKSSSLNRQLAALKAALNWAERGEYIKSNPLKKLGMLDEKDSPPRIRYLSPDERTRLMAALDARESRIREESGVYNMPFADYLKPMILIALNTGIRKGTLFALEWQDIDFNIRTLTLRAEIEKSGRDNHIPLNTTAFQTFQAWRAQTSDLCSHLVFPSTKTGKTFVKCDYFWKMVLEDAGITNFRWHDMRHDFASQLVIHGVDLNIVRELMGHSNMIMTLRYAHLAPETKMKAVEMLN